MKPTETGSDGNAQIASQIRSVAKELRMKTDAAGLQMLSYLIGMVELEADLQIRKVK